MLSNRYCSIVSVVLVGRQGPTELAAVGLAVSLANVSGYSILVGVASTLQTTAGQAFGARNFAEVSLSLQRCGLLCGVMFCGIAVLWMNAACLLRLAGQEQDIAAKAADYLGWLLPGVACYTVTQCLQNWLAAQRVTSPTGSGGMLVALVYLPLCWSIVHPAGFGFVGAAVSTSLANFFLMSWIIFRTRRLLRTSLADSWKGFSWGAFRGWCPFLRLALPNFLMISEWWASEITVLLAGTLPEAKFSLAAMSLMATTDSVCFMPPLSVGIAANTRVSNELGAGQPARAKHAACVSCLLGLACVAVLSMAVVAGRRAWAQLFTTDVEVIEHVMPVLSISALYVLADGLAASIAGSLKGCGRHALLAPVIIVAYYAVGLPAAELWSGHTLVLFLRAREEGEEGPLELGRIGDAAGRPVDAKLGGALKQFVEEESFEAKAASCKVVQVFGQDVKRVALVGLGAKADDVDWRVAGAAAAGALRELKGGSVGLACVDGVEVRALLEGVMLGLHSDKRFRGTKTPEKERKQGGPETVTLLGAFPPGSAAAAEEAAAVASGVIFARELVNGSANVVNPGTLADAAVDLAGRLGLTAKVLDKEESARRWAWAPSWPSAQPRTPDLPPKLIHLVYTAEGEVQRKVGIVGKGVTFDSGGYNLKEGAGAGSMIEMMKFDMGGAAATLGAAATVAQLKPKGVEVHFVVAACENMISGKEGVLRPGDIITAMDGTTIEVNNTDAEGRLTLADALLCRPFPR
ncbi:unnamed protein product, partial [Prorocentrum cordatum]